MDYLKQLSQVFSEIETTDKRGKAIAFEQGVFKILKLIQDIKSKNKIMLIGNGGSASIASHIAADFLKNAGIAALTFCDTSLLTCISNDLGYESVFQKPIEMLAKKNDILFSVSSSGKSKNILNATAKAQDTGCSVITLSGFSKDNPLRKMGDLNFYVPSDSYGFVEITHLAVCHYIADSLKKSSIKKN